MSHLNKLIKFCLLTMLIAVTSANAQTQPIATSANPQINPTQNISAPKAPKASLGITPAIVIANVKAGKTFTQDFTVANSSNSYVRFRCSLGDYWYDKNNAPVLAPAGTMDRSASPWIQFTPSEIVVAPQSSAVVKVLISVPQNAVGGYYAMPFFEGEAVEPPDDKKEIRAMSSIAISIGGLIMLATENASDYKIEIPSGKASPPTDSSELELSLDVVNRGNVHAYLKGVFAILDDKGKLVGQGNIETKMVLPSQTRTIKGTWAGDLPTGNYTILSTLSFERAGLAPTSLVKQIPLQVVK